MLWAAPAASPAGTVAGDVQALPRRDQAAPGEGSGRVRSTARGLGSVPVRLDPMPGRLLPVQPRRQRMPPCTVSPLILGTSTYWTS